MHLERLTVRDFRNYDGVAVAFGPRCNLLLGRNAQGKTNLLEAIAFLATARSFRTPRTTELIARGRHAFRIEGTVVRGPQRIDLAVAWSAGERKATVNGSGIEHIADLLGVFNVVVFTPADIEIVSGAPAARRRFLDMQMAQVNARYLTALRRYHTALGQRNRALKAARANGLSVWDRELAASGAAITMARADTVRRLGALARAYHRSLSGGEELALTYRSDLASTEEGEVARELAGRLADRLPRERQVGFTLTGPHRDDMAVTVNGLDARAYASEGQKRCAAIALRLAEHDLMRCVLGEPPVVLIDDVAAELDALRQAAFQPLLNGPGQVVIAAARAGAGIAPGGARTFIVEAGTVRPAEEQAGQDEPATRRESC